MRGALAHGLGHDLPLGIIPAYAGSTVAAKQLTDTIGDHPRVCGEHPDAPCTEYLR